MRSSNAALIEEYSTPLDGVLVNIGYPDFRVDNRKLRLQTIFKQLVDFHDP
jgi:hypothetical protein